ncbi:ATP-binding protein [Pendulispora albinea]|uniref:ATP-binding protein n=1 Tax=Pendulispora albinea TaxID=2741071 RepID=A0ABZ2M383_9BACT
MSMQTRAPVRIKDRDRQAILRALRAGVVPRVGLQHIQVGRKAEVAAILDDLKHAEEGGAGVRFVIGRFGAGKSFFLNLASVVAIEKGFLVARADITTDRRLHGTGGQARALFAELMRNLASKTRPDGGALGDVIERWLSMVVQEVGEEGDAMDRAIVERLRPLEELVSGFELHQLLYRYYTAQRTGDEETQRAIIRWLRAEYDTKTEAKRDLGVRTIIEDRDFYDYLKLFAKFARIAGYKGLLVCIDELVVLSHRLASKQARASNYEAILRILNDCLQGHVEGLAILFGGTDEAFADKRRGLCSYEALATRLQHNEFAADGVDLSGPVLRLKTLTPEDLYVLLARIRDVFARGEPSSYLLPDEGLQLFLEHSQRRLGEDYFRSPRDAVVRFVGLLHVLEDDPQHDWRAALGRVDALAVPESTSAEAEPRPVPEEAGDLVDFEL